MRGPVGIRESWEAQRLENSPPAPDWRAGDSGAGLGVEAGSVQTGGRGLGKFEEGAESEPGMPG